MRCFSVYGLLGLLSLMLFGCDKSSPKTSQSSTVAKVVMKQTSDTLRFSGEVKPINEAVVVAPADAVVTKLYFKYGQSIKKGERLLTIDSQTLQKNYDETLTNYLKAKDSLAVEKAKFIGSEKLWQAGLIAKNSYEADKSTLYSSEISYIQAKNKLQTLIDKNHNLRENELFDLTLSDVDKVKKALSHHYNQLTITAPISGVVLLPPKAEDDKEIHVGSYLKDSDVIALIGDLSGFLVRIKIPEVDIDKVHPGMKAVITGVSFHQKTLTGEVVEVNEQALTGSASNGLPQFRAIILVKKLPKQLQRHVRIGMSADIGIKLSGKKSLVAPMSALHHDSHSTWVRKKTATGCIKQEVMTGQPFASDVSILSGLKAGDELCLS